MCPYSTQSVLEERGCAVLRACRRLAASHPPRRNGHMPYAPTLSGPNGASMNPLLLHPGRQCVCRSGTVRLMLAALVAVFATATLLAAPARAADPDPSRTTTSPAATTSGETGPVV